MLCLLDDATLFLTSIYHDIAADIVSDNEHNLGDFLIQTEQDINDPNRNTWDGNLLIQLNEIINGKYRAIDILKYGTSSCVYKCQDIENPTKLYSIKILKQDLESEANEIRALTVLSSGPENHTGRPHVDYLIDSFDYNGHRCFVMPLLAHSVVDSINQNLPLMALLDTIQQYLLQLLQAIAYVHSCDLVHSDIKPDNILFTNETMKFLRIIDFGSSINNTPSLSNQHVQSCFYRSPEVILELPCNELIDIWSIGCIAAEMYLDFVPFGCESDFDCVHAMEALLGPFDSDMLPLSSIWWKFYDASPRGFSLKVDPNSVLKTRHINKNIFENSATENFTLLDFIKSHKCADNDRERNRVNGFGDLIMRMLTYDPEKRISAKQALSHPFIVGQRFDEDWEPIHENREHILTKNISEPEIFEKTYKTYSTTPVKSMTSAATSSASVTIQATNASSFISSEINESEFLSMF